MSVLSIHHDRGCEPDDLQPRYPVSGKVQASVIPHPLPSLNAHEVHLWTLTPDTRDIAEYTSLLSPAELERARRFRFPSLFERFVSDHGRLRLLLGSYLQADPRAVEYTENAQGKPRLSLPDCRLRFNLSHTRGVTVIAACLDAEIGVDVEVLRAVEDRDAIAEMYFSRPENEALKREPEEERDAAFLRCWTRKEAYIKARGEGLSLPLDQFAVTLSGKDRAALTYCAWDELEPQRWRMEHLQPMPGYIGALAIEHGPWTILHYMWPSAPNPM
ncbi:4'-phosphopantetheinyl transferase family protein [Silvibacterium sp.]|uniref:4'-phosphopantetheinyl transferase family protein n=1 Tax=Silvibacterium sp. TaxID=1964179 RepID=UPI0039E4D431